MYGIFLIPAWLLSSNIELAALTSYRQPIGKDAARQWILVTSAEILIIKASQSNNKSRLDKTKSEGPASASITEPVDICSFGGAENIRLRSAGTACEYLPNTVPCWDE